MAADSAEVVEVRRRRRRLELVSLMRTKEFLSKLEHDRIVKAIREQEARSSGQIGVYLQRGELAGDPLEAAQKRFQKSEMHKTRHRNAVLIFVAPRAHKFAVVGDEGNSHPMRQ